MMDNCKECGGFGKILWSGLIKGLRPCNTCNGTGLVPEDPLARHREAIIADVGKAYGLDEDLTTLSP